MDNILDNNNVLIVKFLGVIMVLRLGRKMSEFLGDTW